MSNLLTTDLDAPLCINCRHYTADGDVCADGSGHLRGRDGTMFEAR